MERERLLIDTSILIDHLRKTQKDKTVFYLLASQYDCLISAITEFEFSIGSTPSNRQFTEELLARLPVLPFDSACVKSASQIYRDLKTKNQLISLPDIFIAATAITYDLQLSTLNKKHFERVENLKLHT
ncbi:type II toxin-antitoxin system VapC family toxin [candidate division KSB1 bacterium]|nr:type II toxin-antitoxin system VapC family toxin [candidate division KSB1 bacterium]